MEAAAFSPADATGGSSRIRAILDGRERDDAPLRALQLEYVLADRADASLSIGGPLSSPPTPLSTTIAPLRVGRALGFEPPTT